MARRSRLLKCLDGLAEHQGDAVGGPPQNPWAAVLWENVVGAADELRRDQAFAALAQATALDPARIAAATDAQLLAICGNARGAPERVVALRACVTCRAATGDPGQLIERAPAAAIAALQTFPGVDRHIAERILLFAGRGTSLSVDAYGLRAIVRIGYGDESADAATTRRTAEAAAALEVPDDAAARIDAFVRLRHHGLTLCTRRPNCDACPIARLCEAARLDGKNR